MNVNDIQIQKQLGAWKPNQYLSNLCMAYFEEPTYAARRVFPVCPVQLPSGYFYTFSKADLARDSVQRKPDYGAVQPAVLGVSNNSYQCHVDQIIVALDKLVVLPFQRDGGAFDPERARVKTINEQICLHQEIDFAQNFFKASAWANVWTGATSDNAAQKKFKRFDDATSDPINFIDARCIDIRREGRRRPNKLVLGIETFVALKNHPKIAERVKYTGTNQAPAVVNENVLAQIFGLQEVVVLDATFNAGTVGEEKMQFVCDAKSALLLYAPAAVAIDEPSAGYCFTWTIDGANLIAVDRHEGAPSTHTDILEAVIAYDFKKTSDDLACFLTGCVS